MRSRCIQRVGFRVWPPNCGKPCAWDCVNQLRSHAEIEALEKRKPSQSAGLGTRHSILESNSPVQSAENYKHHPTCKSDALCTT